MNILVTAPDKSGQVILKRGRDIRNIRHKPQACASERKKMDTSGTPTCGRQTRTSRTA